MAGITSDDMTNATRYAFERQKLVMYNYFCYKYPHIFKGKTFLRIRFNNEIKGAKDPLNCIKVDWCGTKEFCDKIFCQKYIPYGGTCTAESQPLILKSGDSTITACNAGCYSHFHEDAEFKGQMTLYSERQRICLWQPDMFFGMAIDPFLRTDVHPTPRVDTIGTGFDVDFSEPYVDDEGNETFKFKLNRYYCDDFKYEFDVDGMKCKPSLGERIFGIFGSELLYKAFQYGARYVETGVTIDGVQKIDTGPVDSNVTNPSILEWKNDVNEAHYISPDLSLASLGMTMDNYKYLMWTTESSPRGELIIPKKFYEEEIYMDPMYRVIDFLPLNRNRPDYLHFQNNGVRVHDEYEALKIYDLLVTSAIEPQPVTDTVAQVILEMLENMGIDLVTSITVPKLVEIVLKHMGLFLKDMQRLNIKLTQSALVMLTRSMADYLLSVSLSSLSKILIKVGKLAISALKGIFIVFDLLGIIDLISMGADPYNLKKLVDQRFVDNYSAMSIFLTKKVFGRGQYEMSPIFYASLLLQKAVEENQNSIIKDIAVRNTEDFSWTTNTIQNKWSNPMQDILWKLDYLSGLEFNSNGLKIDHDMEQTFSYEEFNAIEIQKKVALTYDKYIAKTEKKKRTEILTVVVSSVFILPILMYFNILLFLLALTLIAVAVCIYTYAPSSLYELSQYIK